MNNSDKKHKHKLVFVEGDVVQKGGEKCDFNIRCG